MKLVVDIPKNDLDFFRQFIQRMKGAKMEDPESSKQHVVLSKKEYETLCEELEMKHDVAAFKKAIKQGTKGSVTIEAYKKQRAKRKIA